MRPKPATAILSIFASDPIVNRSQVSLLTGRYRAAVKVRYVRSEGRLLAGLSGQSV